MCVCDAFMSDWGYLAEALIGAEIHICFIWGPDHQGVDDDCAPISCTKHRRFGESNPRALAPQNIYLLFMIASYKELF